MILLLLSETVPYLMLSLFNFLFKLPRILFLKESVIHIKIYYSGLCLPLPGIWKSVRFCSQHRKMTGKAGSDFSSWLLCSQRAAALFYVLWLRAVIEAGSTSVAESLVFLSSVVPPDCEASAVESETVVVEHQRCAAFQPLSDSSV